MNINHQQKRDKLAKKYENGERLKFFGFIVTALFGLLLFVERIINLIQTY